MQMKRKCK